MKNLENYGVQEMNTKEMENTDGGFIIIALAVAAALLLGSCAVYESAEVFVEPYQGCGCGCDSSCCP